MDVIVNILLWIHIIALVAGGSNAVVGPVIGARLGRATPDAKAAYIEVLTALSKIGKVAMVTLLITGPLMLWLRYGGFGGVSVWFWIKMALIVVLLAAIIIGEINFKKAQAGDMAAAKVADLAHKITGLAFAGVLLAAVLAFN
jgi:putative membrane protein